jgi:hypothetical protein
MRNGEGGNMLNIHDNIGRLVATETQGVLRAIDDAILTKLRLCTILVEAFEATNLPVGPSQKLLQLMATGLNHIVAGRGEMAHTARALATIKGSSNLRETSYNCPGQMPPLSAASEAVTSAACPAPAFG